MMTRRRKMKSIEIRLEVEEKQGFQAAADIAGIPLSTGVSRTPEACCNPRTGKGVSGNSVLT